MNKLRLFLVAFLGVGLLTVAGTSQNAYAEDIQGNLCSGAELSLSGSDKCNPSQCQSNNGKGDTVSCQKKVNHMVGTVINILSMAVGIVAVIMIIYGGFRYVTSGGDSNQLGTAKNTIIYAIVGLVIVGLAQFIVKFVLGKATNSSTV